MEDVSLASDLLLQHENCPDEAKHIVRYFIHTYIGFDGQQPLFPIRFWSVYDRKRTNCFRTNQGVFKCIEKIMKEQKTQNLEMQRLNAGEPPQKKQKKYRALDQRLRTIVNSRSEKTILEYLKGIAHNLN